LGGDDSRRIDSGEQKSGAKECPGETGGDGVRGHCYYQRARGIESCQVFTLVTLGYLYEESKSTTDDQRIAKDGTKLYLLIYLFISCFRFGGGKNTTGLEPEK
jgi:hypothetical protein